MSVVRIFVATVVLRYVAYFLVQQPVWLRQEFAWKTREEYPKVFLMSIIGGTLIGVLMLWNLVR